MSEHGLKTISYDEYAATPGVSATTLDYMRRSPAHGRAYELGQIERETDSLSLGKVVHYACLEPDLVEKTYSVKPEGMNFATKEGKAWRAEQGERPIISHDTMQTALRCRDSVHRNPVARALLSQGLAEQSLFIEDDGLTRKCRFDYVSLSGNTIPDVKTTRDASPAEFEKAVFRYQYWIRGAYYLDNAAMAGLGDRIFCLIAVETEAPYCAVVYQIPDEVIDYGRRIYEADLQRYRNCLKDNEWPGYFKGIQEVWLPPWAMKQLEQL